MTSPSPFSDNADTYDSGVYGGGSESRIFIQRFKNPETRIRLCQEPNNHPNQMKTMREHYSSRFKESFACPNHRDNGVPCVGCADPDSKTRKRNRRFVTNALNDRGELILIKMGPDLHKKFVNKRQRMGTVLNCDWIVVKTGSGLTTDYEPWPGEEYPVPMPTQLIDIDKVLADGYNSVAAQYLNSTPAAPVAGGYGASPFIDPTSFGAAQGYGAPQGYQPPPPYGQPAAPGGAPQGGRITPTYAGAQQPAQGSWPPPPGQSPTPPPTGQPAPDPWQQQAAQAPDSWTTPPAPDNSFTPMIPGPQITPQYGQPAPAGDPWSQVPPPQQPAAPPASPPAPGQQPPQGAGSLFNPPAVDPGPAPWEQPGPAAPPAAAQPQSAAEQPAAPAVEPAAGPFPVPGEGTPPKPKDMTIKELRAWLSDPERGVEFPAQAARSRLVKLAEEWQAANPE